MHDLADIIRDLLVFVVVMTMIFAVLLVVVSRLPDGNPLRRILAALCYRIGFTLAAAGLAIPIEPIPGLDAIYDVGMPVLLVWAWYTFLRDTLAAPASRRFEHGPRFRGL